MGAHKLLRGANLSPSGCLVVPARVLSHGGQSGSTCMLMHSSSFPAVWKGLLFRIFHLNK